jgi:hypothetical protein
MMKIRKSLAASKQDRKASGYIERLQSSSTVPDDEFFYIEPDEYLNIKNEYPDLPSEPINSMSTSSMATSETGMVGTELKKIISWFPIPNQHGCKPCQDLEAKMNRWGPDMCEKQMDYICHRLKEASHQRGLPFSRFVSELIVKRAINKARTKMGSCNSGASN